MRKKTDSKYILLGVIVIALGLFGFYFYNKNNPSKDKVNEAPITGTEKPQPVAKIIDRTLATEQKYNTPDTYTVFDVVYPQFKNAGADFNKKIEDTVMTGIASQKKDSADNWKARYDTQSPGEKIPQFPAKGDKFTFNVSWEPTQVNNQYISFVLIISGYTGGAHGYQNMVSFNYDVVNKKEISLAELFPNDPNYLKTISAFSVKDLTAQFHTRLNLKTKADEQNFKESVLPMLLSGTEPVPENFSIFTFTPKTVTIYFSEYQVAPYAMGESKVTIARK